MSYYTCKHGTSKKPCCAPCRDRYRALEGKERKKLLEWRAEASRIWHKTHSGIEDLDGFKKFIKEYVAKKSGKKKEVKG